MRNGDVVPELGVGEEEGWLLQISLSQSCSGNSLSFAMPAHQGQLSCVGWGREDCGGNPRRSLWDFRLLNLPKPRECGPFKIVFSF